MSTEQPLASDTPPTADHEGLGALGARLRATVASRRPGLVLGALGLAMIAQWRFLEAGGFDLPALLAGLLAGALI